MGGAVHLYLGDVGIGSLGSRRKFTARQALLLGEERRTLLYEVRLVYGRRWQQEGKRQQKQPELKQKRNLISKQLERTQERTLKHEPTLK